MNRANAIQGAKRYADAVTAYDEALVLVQKYAPPIIQAKCHVNRANSLAALGRYSESVAGHAEARRLLRQTRRHAGVDDTGLEFHSEHAVFYHMAVIEGLAGGLPDAAYDAAADRAG